MELDGPRGGAPRPHRVGRTIAGIATAGIVSAALAAGLPALRGELGGGQPTPRPPSSIVHSPKVGAAASEPRGWTQFESAIPPIEPTPGNGVAGDIAGMAPTPGLERAVRSVVRVVSVSSRCRTVAMGSGWPATPDTIVTNAHVVTGGESFAVQTPSGKTLMATLDFYDPRGDIAVLEVPGLNATPLRMATTAATAGSQGAIVGYPRGGPEREAAAAIDGPVTIETHDIDGRGVVTRRVDLLSGTVIPGNSGGPLVNDLGQVDGVVFALLQTPQGSQPVGMSMTVPQVSKDVASGIASTTAVSSGDCPS